MRELIAAPACLPGVKARRIHHSVEWRVTLRDPIWQVTLRSSAMPIQPLAYLISLAGGKCLLFALEPDETLNDWC